MRIENARVKIDIESAAILLCSIPQTKIDIAMFTTTNQVRRFAPCFRAIYHHDFQDPEALCIAVRVAWERSYPDEGWLSAAKCSRISHLMHTALLIDEYGYETYFRISPRDRRAALRVGSISEDVFREIARICEFPSVASASKRSSDHPRKQKQPTRMMSG